MKRPVKKVVKKVPVRKPSRLERLADAVRREHNHLHSMALQETRKLYEFERSQLTDRVTRMTAAIVEARERRANLEASIAGIDLILSARATAE